MTSHSDHLRKISLLLNLSEREKKKLSVYLIRHQIKLEKKKARKGKNPMVKNCGRCDRYCIDYYEDDTIIPSCYYCSLVNEIVSHEYAEYPYSDGDEDESSECSKDELDLIKLFRV